MCFNKHNEYLIENCFFYIFRIQNLSYCKTMLFRNHDIRPFRKTLTFTSDLTTYCFLFKTTNRFTVYDFRIRTAQFRNKTKMYTFFRIFPKAIVGSRARFVLQIQSSVFHGYVMHILSYFFFCLCLI